MQPYPNDFYFKFYRVLTEFDFNDDFNNKNPYTSYSYTVSSITVTLGLNKNLFKTK